MRHVFESPDFRSGEILPSGIMPTRQRKTKIRTRWSDNRQESLVVLWLMEGRLSAWDKVDYPLFRLFRGNPPTGPSLDYTAYTARSFPKAH